ncbi:hypothetical protein PRIPAC_88097 [Pristionchus pacificus]|uniref:NADH dehydrogenase [ubiquinone] iron-sulfur protein 4, mitochondrial n=1 Tax=Pristionchus pacificus TaxID=54126 RepID=A0A2A6B6J9_PRIPA|nr:hypothetical protein PRIPAC_88097 [Pristionchus pacificus]|eukprot:PDM61481.1 hypothetical protein PRIPAC_50923 [Pristionchus pacificus]
MLRNIARPFARVATRSASVPVKPNTPQHLKRPAAAMMNDHIFDALRSPNCIFSESKRNPNLKKTGNDPTQASAAHESHSSAFDGYDEEPHPGMIARIRKTAEQGNNMGKSKASEGLSLYYLSKLCSTWKIDLDNYEESSFLGPSGEPLPIVTAHMKFSTIEDAIAFCEENNWAYELDLINQDKY